MGQSGRLRVLTVSGVGFTSVKSIKMQVKILGHALQGSFIGNHNVTAGCVRTQRAR